MPVQMRGSGHQRRASLPMEAKKGKLCCAHCIDRRIETSRPRTYIHRGEPVLMLSGAPGSRERDPLPLLVCGMEPALIP